MMLVFVSQSEAREFKSTTSGKEETVKVVEVTLGNGLNLFTASAFDKQAQRLIDHPVNAGALVVADLIFSVRTAKTEKGEFPVQQVRLANYSVLT